MFTIGLHSKDFEILKKIQTTLGVGTVNTTTSKVVYAVESIKDLNVIINHFKKYPLVTAKLIDFLIFEECFELINKGEHLIEEGLLKIITLKSSLNLGNPDKLTKAFPNIIPMVKPTFIFRGIPDPFWISGFTAGDGSFNLKVGSSATTSIGLRI